MIVQKDDLRSRSGSQGGVGWKVEALWQGIMAKFLRLSQCSEYISATNNGHYIHLTDEDLLLSTADRFLKDKGV